MRPGAARCRSTPTWSTSCAVRFERRAAQSARRARRARGRDRGDVRPRLDRRAARRAADRGALLRMLEGTHRRRPDEVVATVPPDLVDVTVEKVAIAAVMAGCLPEYLPWVLAAIEAVVHRRVQHPRRAGHDDARRAGDRRQRPDAGDRHERRRQRPRSGQPGQPDDRAAGAARRAQRRRRAPGRGRPGDARQPRQAVVLLRRGRGARRSARWPRAAAPPPAPTPSRCSPARVRAASSTSCRASRRASPRRWPRACARCTTPSSCSASTPSSWSAPSTPGCSPRPAGTAPASDRARRPPADPGDELVRGAGGIAEGVPEAFAERDAAEVPPGGILLAYAGGGAGLFSAIIGGWANGAIGSQPVTREVHDHTTVRARPDRRAQRRRARSASTARPRSPGCASAARHLQAARRRVPRPARGTARPRPAPRAALPPSRRSPSRRRSTCATRSPRSATS